MGISRVVGIFALVPATVLLTISFFVLLTLHKAQAQGLKAFGYVIAVLLWVVAFLVFSTGIYVISTGRAPMKCMMQEMMRGKMHGMMMRQETPLMMHGQKQMMMKDKLPPMGESQAPDSMTKR